MSNSGEDRVEDHFKRLGTITDTFSIETLSQVLESRCNNCYNYWNRTCVRCSRCGSPEFTPCPHCDFDLR